MSDSTLPGQEPAAATTTAEAVAEAATAATAGAEDEKEDPFAALPEEFRWVADDLKSTRREAGNYRAQLRDAEARLEAAKTPEEFAAAVAEGVAARTTLETELARERVARSHGFTDEHMALITATDADAIAAQATALAALIKPAATVVEVTQVPLNGGANPSVDPPNESGRDAWRKFKNRR